MTWPIDMPLEDGARLKGTAYGVPLELSRHGLSLILRYDEKVWDVGIPEGSHHIRFGPSLGPLPFLLFPSPPLLIPSGCDLRRTFSVPLHLDIAVVAKQSNRVRELTPHGFTKSLYGPVDMGTICWTVRPAESLNREFSMGETAGSLAGSLHLTIENNADGPHGVEKIMIPVDMVGLYSGGDVEQDRAMVQMSDVRMRLLGELTADLTMEPPRKAKQLPSVSGYPIRPSRRSFAFSHEYRNRTGLDYGF